MYVNKIIGLLFTSILLIKRSLIPMVFRRNNSINKLLNNKLSFVSDFVHNRPQKIKVFFLNKFEFVMRQMLSYGGMYFFRTAGFSISKSIMSEIF